jgi:outer membrane protein
VKVGDATTVILVYERLFGPNLGAELVMGIPPTIKAKAAGSVEFLNATGTVLETENWSPTVLFNYHFFEPGATWRPYVGAGINYTKFKNTKSSLAPNAELGSSWGPAVQVGIEYAITKDISAFASLAALKVKSKVVASDGTVLTTTVDFRPTTYSLGVAYKF